MKKLLKLLVFSGSLLLLVACGKEAPAADRSPGKLSKQSPDQPEQLSGPRGDAPATLPKSVAQPPSAAADNVTSLNCVLSNKVFGVGGWRVVLNTTKMTASASFIGTPNSWFGLTGILLDTTYPLTADNSSDAGSFYTFGLLEGQNYRLFVINRENLQFRYAASDTGMTDWGRCNRTPVIVPL